MPGWAGAREKVETPVRLIGCFQKKNTDWFYLSAFLSQFGTELTAGARDGLRRSVADLMGGGSGQRWATRRGQRGGGREAELMDGLAFV